MSEYEIADLLVSNRMLEQQQYAILQSQLQILWRSLEIFMTISFGFLISAHFIGAKLSRGQVVVFSTAYGVWGVLSLIDYYFQARLTEVMMQQYSQLPHAISNDLVSEYYGSGIVDGLLYSMLPLVLLGSFYFMWSVRHPKK